MIRLPDIPNLQPAAINAPAVRLSAAVAPVAALDGVAREIANVSDHFHNTAVQVKKLENARLLSETRQQLAAEYSQHLVDLEKDPDPESRIQKTRDFLGSAKLNLDTRNLPPAVRDQALAHFGEFESRALIDQTAETARLATKRAGIAMQNELEAAKRTGNRQAYELVLKDAEEAGVIFPEQKDTFIQDFERTTTGTAVDLAIQEDPRLVLEDIERPDFLSRMPGLSQEDIPRIRAAARASSQRKRGEELDLIEAAIADDKLTPEDLEGAEYLSPSDVAKVKQALQKVEPPTAEVHGKAWDLLLANREKFYDPGLKDSDYAATWNNLRAEVIAMIPTAYRGDINSELAARSPANRNAARVKPPRDLDKAELKTISVDRIGRARSAGMFGDVSDEAPAPVREKAYRRAEELRVKVSRFIEQNPEAGIQEITEYTDSLISGDRVKNTAAELQTFIPGSGQRFRAPATMAPLPGMAPGQGSASGALLPPREQLETFLNSDQ